MEITSGERGGSPATNAGDHPGLVAVARRLDERLIPYGIAAGRSGRAMGIGPEADRPPHWLMTPIWLHEAWVGRNPDDDGALETLLWGQFCLYLAIRIQDDLLDGQRGELELQFIGDEFLIDAQEAFGSLDGLGRSFWPLYTGALRATVRGILDVRRMEAEPGGFEEDDLDRYADVAAIFTLGAAAVCHRTGRPEEAAWLGRMRRGLAVLGQLRDDLEDLEEDLSVGRCTWVGNVLTGCRDGGPRPSDPVAAAREGLLLPSRTRPVWQALSRAAAEAADSVPPDAPAPLVASLAHLEREVEAMAVELHGMRVAELFDSGRHG